MGKGKQAVGAAKRKGGDKDGQEPAVVSKRPVLQMSTGINIPARRSPSETTGDNDDEGSPLTPPRHDSQREAFEKLKQQNEELLKSNDQLKQDKLGLRQEKNRAADEIHHLKTVVAIARQKEAWVPVKRPSITKDGSVDFRLTSTQELLGLQLDGEDYNDAGQVNSRGYLKEQCWKYLLTCSRDTITWGTTERLIGVLPDWRYIKPIKIKEQLLDKFDELIREIPCLKALFHHGDKYRKMQEAEVWEDHWSMAEMLKSTMDGIKGTDKRQKDVKNWLVWYMMIERPQNELDGDSPAFVGDWPPPRARRLTTQIIHRRGKVDGVQDGQAYEQDDSLQPRSRRH